MTGHGRGEAMAGGVRAVVECFSVNRKQGEVSVACARDLAWLEPRVREEVLKRVARGKVQVSLALESAAGGRLALIDFKRAAAFLDEVRALQARLDLAGEISVQTVLAAPGVLRSEEDSGEQAWPVARRALAVALDALLEMRAAEGGHLQKDLLKAAEAMAAIVRRVRKLAPAVPRRQRANLQRRLKASRLPLNILDPRVTAEIAVFAERCDITEELARLDSHLAQFRKKLDERGPIGRTLEFLAQEMGREWNTVGAKANDASISRLVVAAKAALDRIREQLANIE